MNSPGMPDSRRALAMAAEDTQKNRRGRPITGDCTRRTGPEWHHCDLMGISLELKPRLGIEVVNYLPVTKLTAGGVPGHRVSPARLLCFRERR